MNLPIEKYRGQILSAIEKHPVVIICADTGAGKSTKVPQYLLGAGYRTVATQPRRLAARSLAERVASEVGCELGGVVGYRTGYESLDSPATRLLFCTDGLELVRELSGQLSPNIVVIDETHEMSVPIETLLAWTRKRIEEGWSTKLVLMSATLDAEKLAAFYGPETPIISVPGRTYPVTMKEGHPLSLVAKVKRLVDKKRNVLVFQPGKREIEETIRRLQAEECRAVILPLHAGIEPAEQRRIFENYDVPKVVVATNLAQTSLTVDDIDAVVDSGEERRLELSNAVEGLYLRPISKADCMQRKGRAGRTRKGTYILCGVPLAEREEFPTPEIRRCRLDGLVLRLAVAGVNARDLRFFHQPAPGALLAAEASLYALGAVDSEGKVTETGRLMARLPLEPRFARMIVEGQKLRVTEEVVTIACILSVGGLRSRGGNWRQLSTEKESDLLLELDLWNVSRFRPAEELEGMGVDADARQQAFTVKQKVLEMLKRQRVRTVSTGNRQDIVKACVAGMVEHLHRFKGGNYRDATDAVRTKHRACVVRHNPQWVVGVPFNLEVRKGRKLRTRNLLTMVSAVDPFWLVSAAPHLVSHDYSSGIPALTFVGHTIRT